MTLQDFIDAPDEHLHRLELARGMLVREPQPGARHGSVAATIYDLLHAHAHRERHGRVLFETGFLLEAEPPTVRRPDVAFLRADRLIEMPPVGFWRIPPDLAVEVLSPANRLPDMHAKASEYLAAGTERVWIVDPHTRTVVVRSRNAAPQLLGEGDTIDSGAALPGLELAVAALFEWRRY